MFIATGIILAEESLQINSSLVNNIFESNRGLEVGTAFNTQSMQNEFSSLLILNNTFKNNTCKKNGGVYGFVSTRYIVNATDNKYLGNSVGIAGGVGYVYESRLFYTETNAVYTSK